MAGIADHGVRPVRRQVNRACFGGDPQEILEQAYNDEAFSMDIQDFAERYTESSRMISKRKVTTA